MYNKTQCGSCEYHDQIGMTTIPWNPHAYIVYHESYREGWQDANGLAKIAHVATPQWMLDGPSLFQVNDPVVLCGSCGGDATAKRTGYVRSAITTAENGTSSGSQSCRQGTRYARNAGNG